MLPRYPSLLAACLVVAAIEPEGGLDRCQALQLSEGSGRSVKGVPLWSTDITQGLAPDLWLGLPAAMVGAAMGASLTGLLHRQQPQYKSFDRLLRRKLHDGCWVVLVHDLPWTHQARVLDVFSRQGQNWSAVSSAAHG